MNLPPQVMSTLQGIDADLKRLEEYLYEEQTELGQLRALANMSAAVTTSLDIDVVLNEAMDIVIALTKAERGYIVLVDRETGTLEFRVIREDSLNPMRGGTPQISSTVLQEVLSTRQPCWPITPSAMSACWGARRSPILPCAACCVCRSCSRTT